MTVESDKMKQSIAADGWSARSGLDAGALDIWLHRALAERFDSTLEETLPPELTRLLSDLH